jgi:signal peptidase II
MNFKAKKTGKAPGKLFEKENLKDLLIITGIIILDQLTKYFALKNLTETPIIKNVFHLTLVKNTGIGFGLLRESNTLLIFLTITILALIVYYFKYLSDDPKYDLGVCLVTGGAISNIIDRIFRNFIIDFINFKIWPVFNIADAAITIGIIYLIIITLKQKD